MRRREFLAGTTAGLAFSGMDLAKLLAEHHEHHAHGEDHACELLYSSPQAAMAAPRETLAFVPAIYVGTGINRPDYLAVVDVDPMSSTFGQVVSRLEMPNVGDELHHYGWNACSSCHGEPGKTRKYLVLPGLASGRIHIVDVEDPRKPKLHKVIEGSAIAETLDLSTPHTVHCLADGNIMVSMLGDADGNGPGGFLLIDEKFEIVGRWDRDATGMKFNYDFWYQPRHNVMVSSEWGAPKTISNGFHLEDVQAGMYGQRIHFWDWEKHTIKQSVDLGESGMIPLEVRFHHNPDSRHGYVGAALSSAMWHFYSEDDQWNADKVIQVDPIETEGWPFPVPGLITDLVLSLDDRWLYFSNWLHGDIRQYDVSDPANPKLAGQIWLGGVIGRDSAVPERNIEGGPQMLQLSLDGKRLYVTNSLYSKWDDQFYPEMAKAGSYMMQIDCDTEGGGLKVNDKFFVDFGKEPGGPARAHEIRFPGGDCTSDIWSESPDGRFERRTQSAVVIICERAGRVVHSLRSAVRFPRASALYIKWIYSTITTNFGFLYLWSGIAVLAFCIWISCSRYGNVKLGAANETPQFSTYSWVSMLFCAGVATGILYWGAIEWTYYYVSPPYGAEPRSVEAIEWASTYGIFHWGPTGWAFYCIPALAIGHAYYCRGIPRTRVSTACHSVLGRQTDGPIGRAFDLCFMIGLLGAAGTSLGFGTPMIAAGVSEIFDVEPSYTLTLAIALVCAGIFGTSVYLGLEKGIRRLSDINMAMTFVFLVFVLVAGPTVFILKMGTNGLGLMLQNYVRMHTWTDPLTEGTFVEDWTVFYWAWWVAVGPFMGIFIAEISRGRTFRQIVLGTLTFGPLGCAMYYIVLGNYALYLEINELHPVVAIREAEGAPAAIISVISTLPWAGLMLPFFCVISLIFLATTYDSASYALASSASKALSKNQAPARWHRMFWAFMLALLPTALLAGDGGGGRLKSLQTASLIVSVPLLIVFGVMGYALVKSLQEDQSTSKN